jgi:hypothetical protein
VKIDLTEDFTVTLKCGCAVTFIGSRGHNLTGFAPTCKIPGTTIGEEPDVKKRTANFDRHRDRCIAKAKRFRGTLMEKIDDNESDGIDTEEPPQ